MDWLRGHAHRPLGLSARHRARRRGQRRHRRSGCRNTAASSHRATTSPRADGMNEEGLVANLALPRRVRLRRRPSGKPPMSIALWAQYVLDNFATVAEAVAALEARTVPHRRPDCCRTATASQLHLAISDPSGDSAIFEYLGGKLVVHHGKQYHVMTNSPRYDQQLALNTYWEEHRRSDLPARHQPRRRPLRPRLVPDQGDPRQGRARTSSRAVPDGTYANQAVAEVMSVMRAVSVPLGITTASEPNIASTLWRTVSDQKNKVYFFDSLDQPERLLGAAGRPRSLCRRPGQEAANCRRPDLLRQCRGQVRRVRTVHLHGGRGEIAALQENARPRARPPCPKG